MKTTSLRNTLAAMAAMCITLLALPQQALAQTLEAYVVSSEGGKTLTFYYDTQKASRAGRVYDIGNTSMEAWNDGIKWHYLYRPSWTSSVYNPDKSVTQAVFDSSFEAYRPKSTGCWFLGFTALKQITGLEYLNTSEVTSMNYMFFGCSSLASLDLSKFNTENVIKMNYMFFGCSSLSSLDLSKFNTANVTDMSGMFSGCYFLASLDLSKFNTANVTDMSVMFGGCMSLTSLDLTGFNTANVTKMDYMFANCRSLTSLDLSKFNTANVTSMDYMFVHCTSLATIYCNDSWDANYSNGMFYNCGQLRGAVPYDENQVDSKMANPTTGYFTRKDLTAIAAPTAEAAPRAVYSPDGCRRATLRPGVNLLRMSDGTTRKVIRR